MSSPRTARSRMTSGIAIMAATGSLPGLLSTAHAQQVTAGASNDVVAEVIVTARNRTERLQEVPIPISVVNGEQLARDRVFTVADLTQRAPGLTATTPNARRTGISVRGIGKTSGNDNMEAAVGTIVDDVFLGHVGMTYQDFTDLQQVEILRGPQGTLLGKNTSLGVIKYTTKAPTFDPEGTLELEKGFTRKAFKARGSYSAGIVEDLLAFRASFFLDKQDGDILNVNPARGAMRFCSYDGGKLFCAGLIHICSKRSGLSRDALYSLWAMPLPAVMRCTSPAVICSVWPMLSRCSITPSTM